MTRGRRTGAVLALALALATRASADGMLEEDTGARSVGAPASNAGNIDPVLPRPDEQSSASAAPGAVNTVAAGETLESSAASASEEPPLSVLLTQEPARGSLKLAEQGLDSLREAASQIRAAARTVTQQADVLVAEADLVARLGIPSIVPVHKPYDGGTFLVNPLVAAQLGGAVPTNGSANGSAADHAKVQASDVTTAS